MSDGDQIFGRSADRCRRLSAPPRNQRAGLLVLHRTANQSIIQSMTQPTKRDVPL